MASALTVTASLAHADVCNDGFHKRQHVAAEPSNPVVVKRPMRVVVYGVGDVIRRYVGPAIDSIKASYGAANVQVAFVDTSEFWMGTVRQADMLARVSKMKAEGALYLDKSTLGAEGFRQAMRDFQPNAVFVETPDVAHIANMREIISIFGEKNMPNVFFDKPFGANSAEVRDFFNMISANPALKEKFRGIDHFKAMIKPGFLRLSESFLGGDPEYFHFYLVENHTPTDPKYQAPPATKDLPDAIRREGRQNALQSGLALDLFTTHGGAQVGYFGKLESAVMTSIKAGQYENSPIPAETFGEIAFEFKSYRGNKIKGIGTYGKGIQGVQELGADFDHETFALDLRRGGKRIVANFSAGFVDLYVDGKRVQRLSDPELLDNLPYNHILDNTFRYVAADQADGLAHTIDSQAALTMLEMAEFVQTEVRASMREGRFPIYHLRVGDRPPTVEEIREQLAKSGLPGGNIWNHP